MPKPEHQQSFKDLWVQGVFDNTDYFALTAPVEEWMAHHPTHCISEKAPGISEDGWGIVTWHLVTYIYSSEEAARARVQDLGGNVKPLELKCLSCFAEIFSGNFPFVDLILDESWHIKAFACRDSGYSRATHLRLHEPGYCFQLMGCAGNGSLRWMPYRLYGDPQMPQEYCRPVPFPGNSVMIDHTEQGGYMDMEMLGPPTSIERFIIDGHLLGKELGGRTETVFARPVGSIAFADLMGEKIRLLCGDGVWVPVAYMDSGAWRFPPWAGGFFDVVNRIGKSGTTVKAAPFVEDSHSCANQALALLEGAFPSEDADDSNRQRARDGAVDLLQRGIEMTASDWYARTLQRDLAKLSLDEVPALVHADRIAWGATCRDREIIDGALEEALSHRKEYDLALYLYAMALRHLGQDDWMASLSRLLAVNTTHAQGCFDMALIAQGDGNEAEEMRLYALSAQSDPAFATPWYNMGMIHEQHKEDEKAWDCYIKALEADLYHVKAIEQMGFILHRREKIEEAANMFERALVADPWRKDTYEHITWFCDSTGNRTLQDFAANMFKQFIPRGFDYCGS